MDSDRQPLENTQTRPSQKPLDILEAIQSLQDLIREIEKIAFEKEPLPPRRPRS